jgi:hypothetical protein
MATRIQGSGRIIVDLDDVDCEQATLRSQVEKRTVQNCLIDLATQLARRAYRHVEFKTIHIHKEKETGAAKTAKAIFVLTAPKEEE